MHVFIYNNVYHLLFSCSDVSDSETPLTTACQTSLSFTVSWSLLKLLFIESVMPLNHLFFCLLPLLPSLPPAFSLSQHQGLI